MPASWNDKSQECFWSKEWQDKMKASKEALERGEYMAYRNEDDLCRDIGAENTDKNI